MARPRVIVFGYGPLALASLGTLEHLGVVPAAVVVPGNRRGADVDLVRIYVESRGWPLLVQPPRKSLAPFLETIRALAPDLLLVWSYSMLLPPELIALAPHGAVNVHGGLLPEYRGGHVMNWAIANGERETGATLAYLDDGIDTGPVIAERRFAIAAEDDAASVREHLQEAGARLLQEWWPAIEAGTAPRTPQDESRARYHRMRTEDDGLIDWSASSAAIANLVRALAAPWPGAFTFVGSTKLVLRRALADAGGAAAAPGTVIAVDQGVRVATGTGPLQVLAIEIDGRGATAADLLAAGLTSGVRLSATPH
jgi:methionyl-tRNA formyltransferase